MDKHAISKLTLSWLFALLVLAAPSSASMCEVMELELDALSLGWNGRGHDQSPPIGAPIELRVRSFCPDGLTACSTNADCGGDSCTASCGTNPGDGDECRLSSFGGQRRCIADPSQTCTQDSECLGLSCVRFTGAPMPLLVGGVPTCTTSYLADDLTGSVSLASGAGEMDLAFRWRVHLGISQDTPCPRCGGGPGNPPVSVGDVSTCEGGGSGGQACTVHAVSGDFGGVSFDCPPGPVSNVSGPGIAVVARAATTGTNARQATLTCAAPNDFHPSNGNALCLDDFSACDSNDDCVGGGDCGFYCHCGFCDDGGGADPDKPCFSDSDCVNGGVCSVVVSDSSLSQGQPNACDSFVCGESTSSECCAEGDPNCLTPTDLVGSCDDVPTVCSVNSDCVLTGTGTVCELTKRPCFENTISRDGAARPLGGRCLSESGTPDCSTNADCSVGSCQLDCPRPRFEAIGCMAATASTAINASAAIPGPISLRLEGAMGLSTGVCGDSVVNVGEECDDGNATDGDGCDSDCINRPLCGNGILEDGEECDDGNSDPNDPCLPDCTFRRICGNGILEPGEVCDDGNTLDGDACASDCLSEPVCGNGVTEFGEECDSGNGGNGCCLSSCLFAPIGTSCATGQTCQSTGQCDGAGACGVDPEGPVECDGDICTVDSCGSLGECVPGAEAPRSGCFEADAATTRISNPLNFERRSVRFDLSRSGDVPLVDLGNPDIATDYRLCVYDGQGSATPLVGSLRLPSGSRWTPRGNRGFRFSDPVAISDGVRRAELRVRRSRVTVSAKGPGTPILATSATSMFAVDPSVTFQLVNDLGVCWSVEYSPGEVVRNRFERFKAKR